MVYQAQEAVEEQISEIIRQNPRLSASGISNKLRDKYGRRIGVEAVRKLTNRMIQFDGLRAERSNTGVVVYEFAKEA